MGLKDSRRNFIRKSVVFGGSMVVLPHIVPSTVFGKNAPSNRINVGVIGMGRIARDHDVPGIIRQKDAQIMAVCDLDIKRLAEGKQLVESQYTSLGKNSPTGIRIYEDYRELIEQKDIDAVVITTPDHWHAKPAIEAAIAGKHIYLEKPLSYTLVEGREVSDMVHRNGVIFQLGTQQRSSEQFRLACELVRNGRIGKIHTIRIGLPIDPSGETEPEMPVPANLNYEKWLGPAPYVYYTEKRVHPQNDYSRPGWLRCEPYCLGMITGWGVHHYDIAHWGMGTEHTGPVEVTGTAEFPKSGLWTVHGKYMVEALYANGVKMLVSDEFPNGVRFEGEGGWIFVTRGNYSATSSDPNRQQGQEQPPLTASDPRILKQLPTESEIQLVRSFDHHQNWIESIKKGTDPISPVEVGHRSTSACIISHISMKLGRKLSWDPVMERFINDDEANRMLSRPERYPYGIYQKN